MTKTDLHHLSITVHRFCSLFGVKMPYKVVVVSPGLLGFHAVALVRASSGALLAEERFVRAVELSSAIKRLHNGFDVSKTIVFRRDSSGAKGCRWTLCGRGTAPIGTDW